MDRRELLTAGGSLAVSTMLAGCTGTEQNESDGQTDDEAENQRSEKPVTGENESASKSDDTSTTAENETETGDADTLDLREANVVGVTVDDSGSATDFAVELHHDDDGEDGYANWWQVETLDGTQLGRRELTHPHDEQPFERSKTIEIPDNVTCIVVRGHDQTHDYGGRAVVVNLDSGEQNTIRQGSTQHALSEDDCPA